MGWNILVCVLNKESIEVLSIPRLKTLRKVDFITLVPVHIQVLQTHTDDNLVMLNTGAHVLCVGLLYWVNNK